MTTHGMSKHPAFWAWVSMRQRCYDSACSSWGNYGARGITVCDEWRDSFEIFWADMRSTWKLGLTLDRIDNESAYNLENCRWATRRQQANNRRTNRVLQTPWGRLTLAQASRRSGILHTTVIQRLKRGLSEGDAVTIPVGGKKHGHPK